MAAMVVAAVTILYLGRDFVFYSDELGWLTFGDDLAPGTLLTPHNGHLIAIPRLLYEMLPRVFGPEYLPFRLVALIAFLSCVGLFFQLARRQVGGPIALAPSVVLLFFGSATVIVVSPLAIPFTLSTAFGLGALLVLTAEQRRDLLPAGLLTLSVLCHSFGVIIALGVVIYMLQTADRRRRLWVPAVPLLLYGGWWIWARKFDQGIASLSNLGDVPAFAGESAIATLGALTGVAGTIPGRLGALADAAEVPLVLALAGALVLLFLWLRPQRAGIWFWSYLAIVLIYWVGLGFSEGPGREPTTPRYLFFGSIMVLLITAARAHSAKPTRAALAVLLSFCFVSLIFNSAHLFRGADGIRIVAGDVQAQLGALELAGERADPGFVPRAAGPPASPHLAVSAGEYLEFTRSVGSLGRTGAEISAQPQSVRAGADFVLARAENLTAFVSQQKPPEGTPCERRRVSVGDQATFALQRGTTLIRPLDPGAPEPLLVGRFARPSVPVGVLDAESFATVDVSKDGISEPWIAQTGTSVEICAVGISRGGSFGREAADMDA